MKEKIEVNQGDMLNLLVEKVNFLLTEYRNLHESFEYKGRGKTKVDTLKISNSYENFLKEEGDIKRILKFYDLFDVKDIDKKKIETIKETENKDKK